MHRILAPDLSDHHADAILEIVGDEARHAARVKRLEPGERIEAVSGAGLVGVGRYLEAVKLGKAGGKQRSQGDAGWAIRIHIDRIDHHDPPTPALHIRASAPKGPRLDAMIEQLSQVGAVSWGPLNTTRAVVDPRQGKLDRLERACLESVKQCGRAWSMAIAPSVNLAQALSAPHDVVVADATGEPYSATGADAFSLLVGPEGGFDPAELDRCRQAGARVCSFGSHVMRIETAAVAAAAVILDAERRSGAS